LVFVPQANLTLLDPIFTMVNPPSIMAGRTTTFRSARPLLPVSVEVALFRRGQGNSILLRRIIAALPVPCAAAIFIVMHWQSFGAGWPAEPVRAGHCCRSQPDGPRKREAQNLDRTRICSIRRVRSIRSDKSPRGRKLANLARGGRRCGITRYRYIIG
jgi:hypothetical protein